MTFFAMLGAVATIIPQGDVDMTATLLQAVKEVRAAGGGEICLTAGTYHFRSATAMSFYVSNHDNPMPRNVFLPITNVTDLVMACEGRAEFVFHGEGIGIELQDTKNVRIKGIGLDWDRPYFNEVTVDDVEADGTIVIAADKKQFPLELDESGRLVAVGEGWRYEPRLLEVFSGTRLSRIGGAWIGGLAEARGANGFRLLHDMSKENFVSPLQKGDFAVLRSGWRPNPAVHCCRADGTVFEDCAVHSSAGMGIIAQRCENVTVRGSGTALDKTAGSFARAGTGRRLSLQADATHFSNCKGKVVVENCLFEGMCDDAVNVHSTCLGIERVDSPTRIACRYKHRQSCGFEVFLPGENLRAIRARTMESAEPLVRVVAVGMMQQDMVLLTLAAPLPDGIGVGDAVENADWQPSVVFRNNVVRNSSPRAALFTTPGEVVCEGNVFEHISAQAIHLSGDASNWYESGGCRDVVVRNNVFRDVCILGGKAVIQIDPNVKDIARQKTRYHRNVTVENNVFLQEQGALLYARSVSNLVWNSNRHHGVAAVDIKYCDDFHVDLPTSAEQ